MLKNRLQKNLKKLTPWAKDIGTEAFRVYDKDMPEYPYLIDRYGPYFVVYEQGKKDFADSNANHDLIRSTLTELTHCEKDNIIFKKRKVIEERKEQYQKVARSDRYFSLREGPARFRINVHDYLDNGLFLDQRPLRKLLYKTANDKKVLNLFSYTSSLSVMAALAGAQTTSVDLSQKYLEWSLENFKLNDINMKDHRIVKADVFQFLDVLDEKFDIILLDPPTFSNSKSMEQHLDIQRHHPVLIEQCLRNLNPGGTLYFSTNKRKFKIDPNIQANDITQMTVPRDFPYTKPHCSFEIKRVNGSTPSP